MRAGGVSAAVRENDVKGQEVQAISQESTPKPDASPKPDAMPEQEWPLWEVFVRSKAGLDHKHCGSLHATDPKMAIQMARDVYTRRQEGSSVWVVRSDQIVASDPADKAMYFDPAEDKVYRHPTFYVLPKAVDHM
jgi:ring-1,2-phenylacetyl-CoA epoxidase subunit PaaB